MSVFDGLPDIFTGAFGRPVVYTPKSTGVALDSFSAIFTKRPAEIVVGEPPQHSTNRVTLDVPAAKVAQPVEGDTVTIPANGSQAAEGTFKIVQPIQPDGEGMITCTLEAT